MAAALQPRSLDDQARLLRQPAMTAATAYAPEPPPSSAFQLSLTSGRGLY